MIADAPVPQLELSVGSLARPSAEPSAAFGLRITVPGLAGRLVLAGDLSAYSTAGKAVRTGNWELTTLARLPGWASAVELGAGYWLRHDGDVPTGTAYHGPQLMAAGRWALGSDLRIGGLADWRVEAIGAVSPAVFGLPGLGSPIGSYRAEVRVGRYTGPVLVTAGVRLRSLTGVDQLIGPFLALGIEDRAGREGEIPSLSLNPRFLID